MSRRRETIRLGWHAAALRIELVALLHVSILGKVKRDKGHSWYGYTVL
jgi:hypothetical protein